MKECPDCSGRGIVNEGMDDEHQCMTCGGRGFVPDDREDYEQPGVIQTK